MKILVTGGCGFIGSNFIRSILGRRPDISIVNLDALTYAGNPANLASVADHPRYAFVHGDITDAALLDRLFAEHAFDAVVNYAAETHVDRSILDPEVFIRTNVMGTHRLLEAVKKFGTNKFVQISTDEVYGEVPAGEAAEDHPFAPRSPYSASKAAADHLCRAYAETYGLPIIVTHGANMYGPYHYPEKVIPLFILNLMEGKKVPLYGEGAQIREWLHIEDHARAIELILEKGQPGHVYNIGTGERFSNLELTRKILAAMDKGEEHIERVKDRAGHDSRYALNAGKLRQELGWAPQITFADGLRQVVQWYKENEAWWKPIRSGEYLAYYKTQYQDR